MNTIYKIFYYFFITAVIVVGVLLLTTLFKVPGNYELKIVKSGSMEPSIKTGSVVVIKPSAEYIVGDIITFGKDDKKNIPTSHRVSAVRMNQGEMLYTTKGDANNAIDAKEISQKEIIGKVVFKLPYLGYVLDMAKKPIGFVLLVVIPAVVIVYDEAVKIWKEVRRMKRRNLKRPSRSKEAYEK
ncbi:MAG: signal peptidase I [Patescibacteria group bacterium]